MRKLLAAFLAAAMIASVGATATFALSSVPKNPNIVVAASTLSTKVQAKSTTPNNYESAAPTPIHQVKSGTGTWKATVTLESIDFEFVNGSSVVGAFNLPVGESTEVKSGSSAVTIPASPGVVTYSDIAIDNTAFSQLVDAVDKKTFHDVDINGAYYNGKVSYNSTGGFTVKFDQGVKIPNVTGVNVTLNLTAANATTDTVIEEVADTTKTSTPDIALSATQWSETLSGGVTWTNGSGGETTNNETQGDFDTAKIKISDVLKAYGTGEPIPLTENPRGVDKDLNTEGGVQSGATVYFMIRDDVIPKIADDSYWKLKLTKGNNGKYVDSWDDVTKNFSRNLYDANTGKEVSGTGGDGRHRYIKVELKELYTDDEIKITFDMRLSAQSKAVDAGIVDSDDTEIKVKDFSFYMKNIVKSADGDWRVGIGGLMLDPVSNDWNEVTYFDESHDVAFMKFFADSDTDKFFAKLSTKWEHEDYASYFNDQDAYIFNFVGSPKISSTSRCDLQIYNPFINSDGDERIDPTTAVIYQVVDGDLYDVTNQFKYEEGENGDMAFTTRSRFLGTYIICEKAVEEAASTDTSSVPDELTPEVPVDTAPAPTAPPVSDGGKQPANTGRYL